MQSLYHFLFVLLLLATPLIAMKIYNKTNTSSIRMVPVHHTIIIAWDIHDVLINKRLKKMLSVACRHGSSHVLKTLMELYYEIVTYPFIWETGKTCALIKNLYNMRIDSTTSEEFKPLLNEYNPALWPILVQILTEHKPIKGMPEIVAQLAALGYTQKIASNISPDELEIIREKFPHIFSYIEDGLTSHFQDGLIVKKPHADYFKIFCERYKNDDTTIIFIDDIPANVAAAEQEGIIGILFKNPEQLALDLKAMGIPFKI